MLRLDKELLEKVLGYQGIVVFKAIHPRSTVCNISSFIMVSVITFVLAAFLEQLREVDTDFSCLHMKKNKTGT